MNSKRKRYFLEVNTLLRKLQIGINCKKKKNYNINEIFSVKSCTEASRYRGKSKRGFVKNIHVSLIAFSSSNNGVQLSYSDHISYFEKKFDPASLEHETEI